MKIFEKNMFPVVEPDWRLWRGKPGWLHCLDCYLDSDINCWTQVSSIVTHLDRNMSGSVSKRFRLVSDIFCLVSPAPFLQYKVHVNLPSYNIPACIPYVRQKWCYSYSINSRLWDYTRLNFSCEARSSISSTLTNVHWCQLANDGRFITPIFQNTILQSLQYFDTQRFNSIKNDEKNLFTVSSIVGTGCLLPLLGV